MSLIFWQACCSVLLLVDRQLSKSGVSCTMVAANLLNIHVFNLWHAFHTFDPVGSQLFLVTSYHADTNFKMQILRYFFSRSSKHGRGHRSERHDQCKCWWGDDEGESLRIRYCLMWKQGTGSGEYNLRCTNVCLLQNFLTKNFNFLLVISGLSPSPSSWPEATQLSWHCCSKNKNWPHKIKIRVCCDGGLQVKWQASLPVT